MATQVRPKQFKSAQNKAREKEFNLPKTSQMREDNDEMDLIEVSEDALDEEEDIK